MRNERHAQGLREKRPFETLKGGHHRSRKKKRFGGEEEFSEESQATVTKEQK